MAWPQITKMGAIRGCFLVRKWEEEENLTNICSSFCFSQKKHWLLPLYIDKLIKLCLDILEHPIKHVIVHTNYLYIKQGRQLRKKQIKNEKRRKIHSSMHWKVMLFVLTLFSLNSNFRNVCACIPFSHNSLMTIRSFSVHF